MVSAVVHPGNSSMGTKSQGYANGGRRKGGSVENGVFRVWDYVPTSNPSYPYGALCHFWPGIASTSDGNETTERRCDGARRLRFARARPRPDDHDASPGQSAGRCVRVHFCEAFVAPYLRPKSVEQCWLLAACSLKKQRNNMPG